MFHIVENNMNIFHPQLAEILIQLTLLPRRDFLTSLDRRPEDILVEAVVVPEFKLRDIQAEKANANGTIGALQENRSGAWLRQNAGITGSSVREDRA